MPYKTHPVFTPLNSSDKIWRYMDFTKFVSMLSTQSLYFPRSDKFNDPYEGRYPQKNIKTMPARYKFEKEEYLKNMLKIFEKDREYNFILCWHMNEFESAAMWDLYCRTNDEGIAIQTTFEGLCNSFDSYPKDVYIGKVNYIDYEKQWIDEDFLFHRYLHKRKSFTHEQEVRAIIYEIPVEALKPAKNERDFPELDMNVPVAINGKQIPVDLNKVFHKIYISPKAQSWFVDLVTSVLEKYGFDIKPTKSDLYNSPIY